MYIVSINTDYKEQCNKIICTSGSLSDIHLCVIFNRYIISMFITVPFNPQYLYEIYTGRYPS